MRKTNVNPFVLFAVVASMVLPAGGVSIQVQAQTSSRTFTETGKTVGGTFLQYWDAHGGLTQQGFPISEEMQEVSPTDGKPYKVQYFERAVFEAHPENKPPFDVLLSLLGVFYYKEKYPGGAPNQTPNNAAGSVLVPETGKRLGGVFLDYWKTHGALPQQGYPISDEFNEVSDLNGKSYKVQYFERAVFEYHPENAAPYDVLLSQLGTFRYRSKNTAATATPTGVPPTPTSSLGPPVTPTPDPACADIPPGQNMTITPNCVGQLTTYLTIIAGPGFTPGGKGRLCAQVPGSSICSGFGTYGVDNDGYIRSKNYVRIDPYDEVGVWTFRMTDEATGFQAVGYLRKVR